MIDKRKEDVEHSITASLDFILANESRDGSWVDWQLPVGESDAWMTAFVGYKLRIVPDHLRYKTAGPVGRASEWILRNEYVDGGWGYNESVGSDADSTAYAIMFLASVGKTIPERSFVHLREFQREDGGFATYLARNDSWGFSHPDVSPIALLALLTKYQCKDPFIDRGFRYVLKQRTSEGLWNSFWWDTFLWSTETNLSLLNTVKSQWDVNEITKTIESLLQVRPSNAFEAALLISCIFHTNSEFGLEKASEWVDQLLREQLSDGSWKSEPILRLVKYHYFEPWKCEDSGILYCDPKRIFTTSTVFEALCKVYAFI
jgi:hypothetical protein